MSFAEKVKLVRTELKLSQEDLAREQAILGV
jgi:transcriptional regulator with XRE-family HTH domain